MYAPSLGTVHLKTELDAVAVSVPRRYLRRSLRMCVHICSIQCNAGIICTIRRIRYQRRLQSALILKETPPSVITALSLIEYTAHSLMSKFSSVTLILQGGKTQFFAQ